MSAACYDCGNLGLRCGECVITVVPGEQNTHWVPKPDARSPFHAAACDLVESAQREDRNGADALDSKTRCRDVR